MATTFDKVANFVYSTVLTAPSPAETGTTLVVQVVDGANFPDPSTNNYNLVVFPVNNQPTATNAEIVRVTAKTGNSLTIVREQEGTSARLILVGDQVMLSPTAKNIDDITGAVNDLEDRADQNDTDLDVVEGWKDDITATPAELNQLDGVTVGGTSAGDIVTIDDTQTLTNKTIQTTTLSTGVAVDASADPNITYYGMARQTIINGNFDVSQRGTTFTNPSSGSYTLDRFSTQKDTDGAYDIKQTADAPTVAEAGSYSVNCLHLDVTTADATISAGQHCFVSQSIEGYNIAWAGFGQSGTRYITLSFWAKHTKTGIYSVGFKNSASNRVYVAEYTINASDTWEKKVITIPVDTTGTWLYTSGVGLKISWSIACGSTYATTAGSWGAGNYYGSTNQVNGLDSTSNNFKIARVLLNAGSIALPFQPKSFEEELRACQRYYERIDSTATDMTFAQGFISTLATASVFPFNFKVSKRIAPTAIESSGAARFRSLDTATAQTSSAIQIDTTGTTTMIAMCTITHGAMTAHRPTFIGFVASGDYIAFSAEL